MTLLTPFLVQLAARPERPALFAASGQGYSYADLDGWSRSLAAAWRLRGLAPGVRVVVALPMAPPLYAALIALWRLGAVAVFPEPAAGFSGLRHAVAAAQPEFIIAPRWLALLCGAMFALRPLKLAGGDGGSDACAFPDDHPALITFTSGSTGQPKGILRSHGFLLAQQRALAPLLHCPDAVDLVSLPLFVLADLGGGVACVIPDGPLRRPAAMDPKRLLRQLRRHRVNRILAPPAICACLSSLSLPESVTHILTGGGPVFPGLVRGLQRAAPSAAITALYGSTEAEPIAHARLTDMTASEWHITETGGGLLAGHPVTDIRLRLIDEEIVVTGQHVNKGYLRASDDVGNKLRLDGEIWHRTGDSGRLDAFGRLWLMGRTAGRAGGYCPFAVEVAALSWPEVRQAALLEIDGRAILALASEPANAASLAERAAIFADIEVRILPSLPLDRRHNSKIDYVALKSHLIRVV